MVKRLAMIALLMTIVWVAWTAQMPYVQAAGLADGVYSIDYTVKKAEDDSVSIANDYFEKPAKVTIAQGAITVQLQMNHSKWITEFNVPEGSSYVEASVVSRDKAGDKRTVKFAVPDLGSPVAVKMHVTVEDIDYDHDYTVRYVFDTSSMKLLGSGGSPSSPGKEAATPSPTASPSATSTPGKPAAGTASGTKATAIPSATPVPAATTEPKGSAAPAASTAPSATAATEPAGEHASEPSASAAQPSPDAEPATAESAAPSAQASASASLAAASPGASPESEADQPLIGSEDTKKKGNTEVWIISAIVLLAALVAGCFLYLNRRGRNRK